MFEAHTTIVGLSDGDQNYPFIFANTPLATGAPAPSNGHAGHVQVDIYSTVLAEPRAEVAIGEKLPPGHKFATKSASKKESTVSTTLGDPHRLYSNLVVAAETADALLQSFHFQVKSPLAMLSEYLIQPCWTYWWDQQKLLHGIPSPLALVKLLK